MKAQIFSVGTEILLGNITDTNSKFIGQKLTEYGIDVYKMVTIGDNFDRLYQAMKNAYGKVDYIFVTGGLGPTEDDISKEVAIKVIGKEDQVEIDKKSKERIESYFSNNKKAVKVNLKQAKFPKGAIILDNDKGTAPGCIMGDKTKIILLPGPPREMEYMFENKLSSYLKKDAIIKSKNLRIGLLGEWDMANRIDLSSTNPTISPYFDNEGGFLRITAKAKSEKEADFLLNEKEKEVKNVFGNLFISDDGLRKEETLINLLKERNEKVSTCESITGGLIASSIIDISGASEVIEESYITYSDRIKEKILNVSRETLEKYSAVSVECAKEMVEGLYKITNSSLCIGSTGYAHKGEVILAIKYKNQKVIKKFQFSADRNKARLFAKNRALDLAIIIMRGKYEDNIDI
ncbi:MULTISPECIES: CinA family nicotinamide mononucleotide deamidase-related protein [Anaerococcus]|uniref:CinA family nicotinamide mononucleotide deamidase-related protein n=1 Tax=Anaerococcus TaxID=165779 RepID=UPI00242B8088|nr:CinA family nicotinamide mononucleotide deamidase-related protein [Anaerococcus vaginalis]MBS6921546.1 CinA family nicotinamide mononucleotide deamidase-related protein [Anaerococcus vaginalis]MDU1707874.1 CinA family nicotinamide mononucleotide deamidase-related protein [Anaerococcus vaginalis]MDU1763193.1 CinA family nicotinamide mononucleotide deamidase-related protein [Anaerococcus vaginalis]MDU5989062.1 CinA family nicotinamide mononucleotide deamidase-related protein [Anaerococcus vagi